MRTTHVNKSLPVELGEDIVVKSYKRGSPEAAMPIIDPKPSYLILSYIKHSITVTKVNTQSVPNILFPSLKERVWLSLDMGEKFWY